MRQPGTPITGRKARFYLWLRIRRKEAVGPVKSWVLLIRGAALNSRSTDLKKPVLLSLHRHLVSAALCAQRKNRPYRNAGIVGRAGTGRNNLGRSIENDCRGRILEMPSQKRAFADLRKACSGRRANALWRSMFVDLVTPFLGALGAFLRASLSHRCPRCEKLCGSSRSTSARYIRYKGFCSSLQNADFMVGVDRVHQSDQSVGATASISL